MIHPDVSDLLGVVAEHEGSLQYADLSEYEPHLDWCVERGYLMVVATYYFLTAAGIRFMRAP